LDKINFEEFLSCLHRISLKCYPGCPTAEAAMQQLLMDNLLPFAMRRKPIDLSFAMHHPSICQMFEYYSDALMDIFQFYALSGDNKDKGKNMIRTTGAKNKTFDEQKELIAMAKELELLQSQSSHQMNYTDFMRFANDFGMMSR
jgi:hypothetical protein